MVITGKSAPGMKNSAPVARLAMVADRTTRMAAAMRMKAKFAAKAVSLSVRSKIQRASEESRCVASLAAISPSIAVSCWIKGTSTLDSQRTTVGTPAITICWTRSCNSGLPELTTRATSVSVLMENTGASRRTTRTSPEVVCGTRASRRHETIWEGAPASR